MEVEITPYALRRLNKHLDFVFEVLEYTPEQVNKLEDRLINATKSLSKNSKRGQFETYLDYLEEQHRRIIEGRYKIIYYLKGNKVIVI